MPLFYKYDSINNCIDDLDGEFEITASELTPTNDTLLYIYNGQEFTPIDRKPIAFDNAAVVETTQKQTVQLPREQRLQSVDTTVDVPKNQTIQSNIVDEFDVDEEFIACAESKLIKLRNSNADCFGYDIAVDGVTIIRNSLPLTPNKFTPGLITLTEKLYEDKRLFRQAFGLNVMQLVHGMYHDGKGSFRRVPNYKMWFQLGKYLDKDGKASAARPVFGSSYHKACEKINGSTYFAEKWDLKHVVPKSFRPEDIVASGIYTYAKEIPAKASADDILYLIGEYIIDRLKCSFLVCYTGKDTNTICLDLDTKHDEHIVPDFLSAMRNSGLEPGKICSSKTKSGGQHFYFAWTDLCEMLNGTDVFKRLSNGVLSKASIDLKVNGGCANEMGFVCDAKGKPRFYNYIVAPFNSNGTLTLPTPHNTERTFIDTSYLDKYIASYEDMFQIIRDPDHPEYTAVMNQVYRQIAPMEDPRYMLMHLLTERTFKRMHNSEFTIKRYGDIDKIVDAIYLNTTIELPKKEERVNTYDTYCLVNSDDRFDQFIKGFLAVLPDCVVMERRTRHWKAFIESTKFSVHPKLRSRLLNALVIAFQDFDNMKKATKANKLFTVQQFETVNCDTIAAKSVSGKSFTCNLVSTYRYWISVTKGYAIANKASTNEAIMKNVEQCTDAAEVMQGILENIKRECSKNVSILNTKSWETIIRSPAISFTTVDDILDGCLNEEGTLLNFHDPRDRSDYNNLLQDHFYSGNRSPAEIVKYLKACLVCINKAEITTYVYKTVDKFGINKIEVSEKDKTAYNGFIAKQEKRVIYTYNETVEQANGTKKQVKKNFTLRDLVIKVMCNISYGNVIDDMGKGNHIRIRDYDAESYASRDIYIGEGIAALTYITDPFVAENWRKVYDEYVAFFNDVMLTVAGGDNAKFEFLRKYIANMINLPSVKVAAAVQIYSQKTGSGKSEFLQFLCDMVIGDTFTAEVDASSFGEFNAETARKIMVYFDDMSEEEFDKKTENKIKTWTTKKKETINKKGVEKFKLRRLVFPSLFYLTNRTIDLQGNDRRWVTLNPLHRSDDAEYIEKFDKFIAKENKLFAYVVYKYLSSIDVGDVSFKNELKKIKATSTSIVDTAMRSGDKVEPDKRFLRDLFRGDVQLTVTSQATYGKVIEAFANLQDTVSVTNADFYNMYLEWHSTNGFKFRPEDRPRFKDSFMKTISPAEYPKAVYTVKEGTAISTTGRSAKITPDYKPGRGFRITNLKDLAYWFFAETMMAKCEYEMIVEKMSISDICDNFPLAEDDDVDIDDVIQDISYYSIKLLKDKTKQARACQILAAAMEKIKQELGEDE